MKNPWWKERVFYQIYPRSFQDSNGDGIGDIPGLISRLDYLQWLGIGAVWLCPVYDSPNDDMGYDIRDYRKIMSEFGTMEDFDRLLEEMHRREMYCQNFTRLHSASYSVICFPNRYSYLFVLHQEKSKIVVNLLSPQDICCQTIWR